MANNFTFDGEDSDANASIPVVDLDLDSGTDIQFVALQGGTRTVRVDWTALSGSLIRLSEAPGAQADPGTPTSLAVSPNAVYTYILDPDGMYSGWGKTPRYIDNWEDLDGNVRFVPMHVSIEATDAEKETARRNIGVLPATFDTPGLISPSAQYFTMDGAVFSPKAATASLYGVVQLYNGGQDSGEYGMHAVTKTYVDGKVETLMNNLDQNIPTASWGVKGLVALKEEEDPSISLGLNGTISVHKVSDTAVREGSGDSTRGLVRMAGVRAADYDPDTQDTWAAPVALVRNMIDSTIPAIVATDTKAGTVVLTDTIIKDTRDGALTGAITVTDAVWDADDKECQKGIVRLQNDMDLLDDEAHAHQWYHENDAMTPVAVTPAAVRQYVYKYFQEKVIADIVPIATRDTLGRVRGSASVLISTDPRNEGQMTVPLATESVCGIVKISKTTRDSLESGYIVPTVDKADAMIATKVAGSITDRYTSGDRNNAVTASAVREALDTETAGIDTFGTVKLSSESTDSSVTLLPIRMVSDSDPDKDGRIFAEYVSADPIEVAPATYNRYGTVKLGSNTMVDPTNATDPLFPVSVDASGHMYAIADATRVSFPIASLTTTGVVKAADIQLVYNNLGDAAKVTVVAETGAHRGEMYVKAATSENYGSVKLQASMGGWRVGSYDASGFIYITEESFRDRMLENFMAGVGIPGLIRGVVFDLTSIASNYDLQLSCPVGYNSEGQLSADVGAIPAATFEAGGLVKLGSNARLDAEAQNSSSPVRVNAEGRMGVSVSDIRSKMSFNFLENNSGGTAANTYAIGNVLINSSRCAVFGSNAQLADISDDSVAVGYNSNGTGKNIVLVGSGANAFGSGSVVVGSNAEANSDELDTGISVAVGYSAKATGNYSLAVGAMAETARDSSDISQCSAAIGYYARTEGNDAVAVGHNAAASTYSSALGAGADASAPAATVVGAYSVAGSSGTAVGYSSTAQGDNSVAIGTALVVTGNNSAAIGRDCMLATDNVIKIGTGKSFAYIVMVDPNGGDENDEAKPYLGFTKEDTTEETPYLSGKAISLEALFSKLEQLGCPVCRIEDRDGVVDIIQPNTDTAADS